MKSLTTMLMITTALLTAAKDLLLLTFYLVAHLVTGHFTTEAKHRAQRTRLWALMQATGTERKVLLFEYLIFGPVGQTFGAERVMLDLFGAITEPDDPYGTLNVLVATRYDDQKQASFYLEALLEPYDQNGLTLEYQTIFTPIGFTDKRTGEVFCALWPDSTMALMSYYGDGTSEMEAIGFYLDPDRKSNSEDDAA